MSDGTKPVPELGIDGGRLNRDDKWRGEVGIMLHFIELEAHVGTSGDDVQLELQYTWDANEVDLKAPEVESENGKVTPASAVRLMRWTEQATPVWKLTIVVDPYDEAKGAVGGNPVVVVALTERRLDDLARRLWLHPWFRGFMHLDSDIGRIPGMEKRIARERRRVEADLAARAERAWRQGEAD